jgi:hypothetical protein
MPLPFPRAGFEVCLRRRDSWEVDHLVLPLAPPALPLAAPPALALAAQPPPPLPAPPALPTDERGDGAAADADCGAAGQGGGLHSLP